MSLRRPRLLVFLLSLIQRRTLAWQVGVAGGLLAGVAAATVGWQGLGPMPAWAAVGLSGALSALAAAAVARQAMRAKATSRPQPGLCAIPRRQTAWTSR
jgi:membrane associated rhomboid family serine protease